MFTLNTLPPKTTTESGNLYADADIVLHPVIDPNSIVVLCRRFSHNVGEMGGCTATTRSVCNDFIVLNFMNDSHKPHHWLSNHLLINQAKPILKR